MYTAKQYGGDWAVVREDNGNVIRYPLSEEGARRFADDCNRSSRESGWSEEGTPSALIFG